MSFDPSGASPMLWATLGGLWVGWIFQAVWCWLNVAGYRSRLDRLDQRRDRVEGWAGRYTPRAVVIVSVKGADARLADHIRALQGQAYPDYRLLYVVESEQDPARPVVEQRATATDAPPPVELLVAGRAGRGGQKVHNLLYALEHLEERDQVIAFADADIVPAPDWLDRLVQAVRSREVGAATGYRWLVPEPAGSANLPTCLASVINASVATLQGPAWRSQAWGGSMAVRRRVVEAADLAGRWRGALTDDYQLTRAIREHGLSLRYVPRLLVASPVRLTWRRLLEFGRRQYLITRFYNPGLWWIGLGATGLYTAGWLSVAATLLLQTPGWSWGPLVWALVWAADLRRATHRRRLVEQVLGPQAARALRRPLRLDRWATPLWMAVHFALVLSSAFGRRLQWAGIEYHVKGRQDVRILHHPGDRPRVPDAPAPAGVRRRGRDDYHGGPDP